MRFFDVYQESKTIEEKEILLSIASIISSFARSSLLLKSSG